MRPAHTVICTVGTSLFRPNLAGLRADDPEPNRQALARAYAAGDWEAVAAGLGTHGPTDRLCGAEINSLASLVAKGYAAADANLVFCHSDTADGQAIGRILEVYFRRAGHSSVQARTITDLQDRDAWLFRTRGLRNLAREVCKVIRDYGAASCAINATGGYKAQIAIAVLMGQALGVPVYYKHELFDEIIAFPPMPVAFDPAARGRRQPPGTSTGPHARGPRAEGASWKRSRPGRPARLDIRPARPLGFGWAPRGSRASSATARPWSSSGSKLRATTRGQMAAVAATLNEWLRSADRQESAQGADAMPTLYITEPGLSCGRRGRDPAAYLVCYDIPDTPRRTRIARCLDDYGGRVWYSVFEMVLDRRLFDDLVSGLATLVEPSQDRVIIYPICAACQKKAVFLGLAESRPVPATRSCSSSRLADTARLASPFRGE